jgi:hypothetical protein
MTSRDKQIGFQPTIYLDFVSEIRQNDTGELRVWYEDEKNKVTGRWMLICYRWVELMGDKYLAVIAISKYAIVTSITDILIYVVLGIFLLTYMVCMVFYIYLQKVLFNSPLEEKFLKTLMEHMTPTKLNVDYLTAMPYSSTGLENNGTTPEAS